MIPATCNNDPFQTISKDPSSRSDDVIKTDDVTQAEMNVTLVALTFF